MSRNSSDLPKNDNRSTQEGGRARDSDNDLSPGTVQEISDTPYYPPIRSPSSLKEPPQHTLFSIFSESTSSLPPKELHQLEHQRSKDAIMAFSPPSFDSKMASVEEPVSEHIPAKRKSAWKKLQESIVGESAQELPPAASGIRRRIVANVALADALHTEKPNPWSNGMIKLYIFMVIAFFNSFANGYISTLVSGLNAMRQYRDHFSLEDKASHETGVMFAMYAIGNIAGSFFCGPLSDLWGRRWGMFHGSIILFLGACIQGWAHTGDGEEKSRDMFMLGRFIVGFGIATNATAGPCYVAEMAHPAWRGIVTGMYNTWFFVGGITSSWICVATAKMSTEYSWRLPILLQIVPASMIMFGCIFIPETPRWLFAHDRQEEAIRVLTKYHGDGSRRSPIVVLTLREMIQHILVEGSDKRWWDYSDLWTSKGSAWRLLCVGGMALFGQWAGNGILTHFSPVLLEHVGIGEQDQQLIYNAILMVVQFLVASLGSFAVERWGRRPLLIITTFMFIIYWAVITSLMSFIPIDKGKEDKEVDPELPRSVVLGSRSAIAMIYMFALTYSFSYTPLQTVYPVECLRYEMRAKGMGFSNLIVNIAAVFNTYGIAAIIRLVDWKFYWIYVAWNAIAVLYIWVFFVETKGRTLEEINEIFVAPNPKKKSLQRHVVDETDVGLLYRGLMEELQNMDGIVTQSAPNPHVAPWTTQPSTYDPPR